MKNIMMSIDMFSETKLLLKIKELRESASFQNDSKLPKFVLFALMFFSTGMLGSKKVELSGATSAS